MDRYLTASAALLACFAIIATGIGIKFGLGSALIFFGIMAALAVCIAAPSDKFND